MTLGPHLENAHVVLEPLEARHREPLREAGSDPDLWRFAMINQHGADFDAWFDARLKAIAEQGEATWATLNKTSGAYVGSTSYLAVVLPHRRLEVGWTWYARSVWAGAVNPSCKRLLFAHGFEMLGLNRIELKLDATNIRSFRAISRLGARFEGIHRSHMVMPDGRIRDTAWFSILKEEWPAVRDGLDARLAAFSSPA